MAGVYFVCIFSSYAAATVLINVLRTVLLICTILILASTSTSSQSHGTSGGGDVCCGMCVLDHLLVLVRLVLVLL